jgi:uncharacterized membrane protein YccC
MAVRRPLSSTQERTVARLHRVVAAVRGWRPDDPGLSSLRRSARAALVMPATFALAKFAVGDPQLTTFVAFGCFALMVMADFGGLRRPRAVAYVVTTLVGAALLTFGTLASPFPWVAAPAMLLVGLWIQFSGVFGSYVAAAQTALLLAFVLAVSVPAPPAAVGSRLTGWLIAGAVSTLASVLLWPRFERVKLHRRAAAACRALGEFIGAQRQDPESSAAAARREAASSAVQAARDEYTATAKRPAGPTRRHRALVELLTQLERGLKFAARPFYRLPARRPSIEEGNLLADAVVRTLDASAEVLTGGPPPDLTGLTAARVAHRQALDRWAGDQLGAGRPPREVLQGLDVDHWLRVLSYLALAVGTDAMIAAGFHPIAELPLPAGTPRHEGLGGIVIRVARTVRTHLSPTSSVLHNSVRTGIGLALAVLLASLLQLDHAFWVVLGTLSVLRSNALATGRTTVEAIAGAVAGFAVGGVFIAVVGSSAPLLWVALPLVVFLAAYASSTIGFVVGQAAFTVLVIVLFNLISPVGWKLGLVRIEDVAIGTAISVAAGLLLWPRGARRELVLAAAGLYRSVAGFVASSFERVLGEGSEEEPGRTRRLAVRARDRAEEAFEQLLNERGSRPLDPATAGLLVASGKDLLLVGDLLNVAADLGYQARICGEGAARVSGQAGLTIAAFLRLADRLAGEAAAAGGHREEASEALLEEAALRCLREWNQDDPPGRSAIAVVTAREWVQQLSVLAADLEEPVAVASRAARVPWWR